METVAAHNVTFLTAFVARFRLGFSGAFTRLGNRVIHLQIEKS